MSFPERVVNIVKRWNHCDNSAIYQRGMIEQAVRS